MPTAVSPMIRLRDYGKCLCSNSTYSFMWIAECAKQAGNWFTFVAAYALINELSAATGHAASLIALFLMCRRLPYLLLFPITGLVADRLNRGALLVTSCTLQAAVSFTLPLVRLHNQIWLLYPLIFLQYSAQAFYDPARAAAVPTVVPPALICVASTLDTFGFSLMALAGASLAGRTAEMYGTALCFRIEGVAFLLAALLLLRLARLPAQTRPSTLIASFPAASQRSAREAEDALTAPSSTTTNPNSLATDIANDVNDLMLQPDLLQPLLPSPHPLDAPADCPPPASSGDIEGHAGIVAYEQQQERTACEEMGNAETVGHCCCSSGGGGCCGSVGACGVFSGGGCCGALGFLSQRRNWDVAALVWVKASGSLVWGAADVLNSRFSLMPAMQGLGGPDQTLGLILAAVGVGCVAGPLTANALTPAVARWWRVSLAAAFALLAAGYSLLATARSIAWVLPATAIRACGSNTLWVHSLAILQHRLPEGIRGRVFALEFVSYTVSEAASTLYGGYAVDHLDWSTRQLCSAMALLAGVFTAVWSLYAWLLWNREAAAAKYDQQGHAVARA